MTLQQRLEELHQNPDTAPVNVVEDTLTAIEQDILAVVSTEALLEKLASEGKE